MSSQNYWADNLRILQWMISDVNEEKTVLHDIKSSFCYHVLEQKYIPSSKSQTAEIISAILACDSDHEIWSKTTFDEKEQDCYIRDFSERFGIATLREMLLASDLDLVLKWLNQHNLIAVAQQILGERSWQKLVYSDSTLERIEKKISSQTSDKRVVEHIVYDETVNPAFDLYREFRAEDERKFREALGENESDNFDDQASEAGADSSGGAVIGTPESWCNMTGGKAVNMEFFDDDTENTMYSEPDYSEERETVEAEKAFPTSSGPEAWAKAAVDVPTAPNPSDSKAMNALDKLKALFLANQTGGKDSKAKTPSKDSKPEKQKEPLRFEPSVTPHDLMFYADTPYVRDDRNPALWRCLYKLDNLIPWLRKRLPKQEQLEVGSGPLKAIAQIYSEHPDYRVDTDPFCKKDGVIPVQNGVVDLSGNVPYLRESYDDEMFDHVVQAEFIPDGQIPSLEGSCFEHFCKTSLGSDPAKHQLLLEIIGYTLCNTVKGKSLFLLIGERDCGKSVVINLLAEMLPPDKITNFTLGQCGDNRNTQQLCNACANLSGENEEDSIKSIHILKACTGGDRISAGRRYKDNIMVKPCVHFVFALNRMPDNQSADTSDAFYRRMRPLVFPYSIPFEQQDPFLLDKLLEEKDLIVTAGIWALHRVMHDATSNYPFTVPESSRAFMDEYRDDANSVRAFIHDCLAFSTEESGYSEDFNKAYKAYCDRNGLEKMSTKRLIGQIKSAHSGVESFRKQENGILRRGLSGVGFRK